MSVEKTPEQRKVMEDEAVRWWDSAHERLRFSVEYAQQGIKALFIANGGGIISLLTFAGNTKSVVEPIALFWSFCWFGGGVSLALLTYIAGYVSQAEVMQDEFYSSRHAVLAWLDRAPEFETTIHAKRGEIAERIGIGCAIGSLVLFIVGAFVGLDAIT